ncbi:unnamed protein product [Amoebophrya sp. A120]|nr:unnamed protein product [Amoebophrya sp. A120]|eukprot:GSA120T00022400001.1
MTNRKMSGRSFENSVGAPRNLRGPRASSSIFAGTLLPVVFLLGGLAQLQLQQYLLPTGVLAATSYTGAPLQEDMDKPIGKPPSTLLQRGLSGATPSALRNRSGACCEDLAEDARTVCHCAQAGCCLYAFLEMVDVVCNPGVNNHERKMRNGALCGVSMASCAAGQTLQCACYNCALPAAEPCCASNVGPAGMPCAQFCCNPHLGVTLSQMGSSSAVAPTVPAVCCGADKLLCCACCAPCQIATTQAAGICCCFSLGVAAAQGHRVAFGKSVAESMGNNGAVDVRNRNELWLPFLIQAADGSCEPGSHPLMHLQTDDKPIGPAHETSSGDGGASSARGGARRFAGNLFRRSRGGSEESSMPELVGLKHGWTTSEDEEPTTYCH